MNTIKTDLKQMFFSFHNKYKKKKLEVFKRYVKAAFNEKILRNRY